ncbi:Choline-sulfatase [Planctomycetes bacterium Pla163]|uniref:Choline-sulfatase n=1 Tax=Rohdeia mirabilis TaxID=2528008 RepID=A0A518D557_9BACT|nr:Choline-sulfatase [Planctomycetes bacterium Pla163]
MSSTSRLGPSLNLLSIGALAGALVGLALGWPAVDTALGTAREEGWLDVGLWRLFVLELDGGGSALIWSPVIGGLLGALLGAASRWTASAHAALAHPLRVVGVLLVAAGLWLALWEQRLETRVASGPNVVWITIDALRAENLGSYGYPLETSPFMDELASEGARFETALSQESYTMASVSSYLTSTYTLESQVLYDKPTIDTLHPSFITVAEVFKDAGYDTGAFVFNPHLQAKYNFDQGFDVYDDTNPKHDKQGRERPDWGPNVTSALAWETVLKMELKMRKFASAPTRSSQRPAFLYLHYRDVHAPYIPPMPYATMFVPKGWGARKLAFIERAASKRLTEQGEPWPFDEEEVFALTQYDGEIRKTDDGLRKLIGELADYGLDPENTIFVITADHGEEFQEPHPDDAGGWSHGRTLYGEQIFVPLIFKGPGIDPNVVVDTPVELIDVAPTLVEAAGIPMEKAGRFRGRSLLPALQGGVIEERPVFTGGNHDRGVVIEDDLFYYRFAKAFKNETKYYAGRPKRASRPGEEDEELEFGAQLFYLANDPKQRKNVIGQRPSVTQEMAALLFGWLDTESDIEVEAVELDEETMQQLRELGYLGDD